MKEPMSRARSQSAPSHSGIIWLVAGGTVIICALFVRYVAASALTSYQLSHLHRPFWFALVVGMVLVIAGTVAHFSRSGLASMLIGIVGAIVLLVGLAVVGPDMWNLVSAQPGLRALSGLVVVTLASAGLAGVIRKKRGRSADPNRSQDGEAPFIQDNT